MVSSTENAKYFTMENISEFGQELWLVATAFLADKGEYFFRISITDSFIEPSVEFEKSVQQEDLHPEELAMYRVSMKSSNKRLNINKSDIIFAKNANSPELRRILSRNESNLLQKGFDQLYIG